MRKALAMVFERHERHIDLVAGWWLMRNLTAQTQHVCVVDCVCPFYIKPGEALAFKGTAPMGYVSPQRVQWFGPRGTRRAFGAALHSTIGGAE
jgi:hypothetical protein